MGHQINIDEISYKVIGLINDEKHVNDIFVPRTPSNEKKAN